MLRTGKPHGAAVPGEVVVGGKRLKLTEVDNLLTTGYTAKYLIGAGRSIAGL